MSINSCPKYVKNIAAIIFSLFFVSFAFSQEQGESTARNKEDNPQDLTNLQEMARNYRSQGLQLQNIGNFGGAMSYYQKAIELDPGYAPTYNDLGVVYEASGMPDRAEESYLKAIQADSFLLAAYSNLALLYESQREFGKAFYYWGRREELGLPSDPWTLRARQRLEDIDLILAASPEEEAQRREAAVLFREVSSKKSRIKKPDNELARVYLEEAKQAYEKGDFAKALKTATDGMQVDPANSDIQDFIEKVQTRALSQ